ALQELRDAAGELDDLEAARQLALGVGENLTVLAGDDAGELVLMFAEQLAKAEEHAGAGQRRRCRPVREGGRGGLDGGIDLAGIGESDAAGALAGCRVEDITEAAARAGDALARYEMVYRLGHCPL